MPELRVPRVLDGLPGPAFPALSPAPGASTGQYGPVPQTLAPPLYTFDIDLTPSLPDGSGGTVGTGSVSSDCSDCD
jgi:hypothetical protein